MIPTENYYKMSNSIFGYGLTPIQFTVFSYLVCAGGRKEVSWYSVKSIAACCSCSEETARKALHELAEMKFIEIEPRFLDKHGVRRQTSNNYYILKPPPLSAKRDAEAKAGESHEATEPLPF